MEVPAGISVVGFDDSPVAELLGLTTIGQSVREQGLTAGRLLLETVQRSRSGKPHVQLETRLVTRGTSSAPGGVPPGA